MSEVQIRRVKKGQSFYDHDLAAGELIEILSVDQWKEESGQNPSPYMLRFFNSGELLPCCFGDGVYRWISPNALECENESKSNSG
jgi:hypothetical protein